MFDSKKIGFVLLLPLLLAATQLLFSQKVTFSVTGGFYNETFPLELSYGDKNSIIRYTTNGSSPTSSSTAYTSPLNMDEQLYSKSDIYTIKTCPDNKWFQPQSVQHCIVIRAAAFDNEGNRVSKIATNSFFINSLGCNTNNLPVISICADSLDLFDYETGILVPGITFDPTNPENSGNYSQSGDEWERICNFEYYNTENEGINQQAGLRTSGLSTKAIPQKGLKLYARKEYGKKRFEYQFFDDISIQSFKHLKLKPFSAGWNGAGVPDYICNKMARYLDIDCLATKPVVLYLNGEYWGIYYLQEKPDERYIEDHYNVEPNNVNIIEGWNGKCENGYNITFLEMKDYIEANDLSQEECYNHVASLIDIGSFIDYQIFEIFTINRDWPANNVRCWQHNFDGKWRWIFFDGDACLRNFSFDAFANAIYTGDETWPSSTASTLFFRKLLENDDFYLRYITRFHEVITKILDSSTTRKIFDETYELVCNEVPNQAERFGQPQDLYSWKKKTNDIDKFLSNRQQEVFNILFTTSEDYVKISRIYPIPVKETVNIVLHNNSKASVTPLRIYDLTGKIVYNTTIVVASGTSEIVLPCSFRSGVYIVAVNGSSYKIVVE